jgi:serine/threonine protein kinase
MPLPAQQVVFNKQPPKLTECSHTEYASHKVVPFTSIKQLGYGSLRIVDAVRPSSEEQGVLLARKVIRLPGVARKRLLPLAQQEVAILREFSHQLIIRVICKILLTKRYPSHNNLELFYHR